jgi:hypothetical protein
MNVIVERLRAVGLREGESEIDVNGAELDLYVDDDKEPEAVVAMTFHVLKMASSCCSLTSPPTTASSIG